MPTISLQSLRQIKPETLHTTPVLADQVAARGLGVFGGGEQHALVARGLFLFADAAGLGLRCVGGGVGGFVGGGEVVDLEGVGGWEWVGGVSFGRIGNYLVLDRKWDWG